MGEFLIPDGPLLPPAPPPDPMVAREEKIANDTRVEQALNSFLTAKQGALFGAPDAFYRTQGEGAIHAAPIVSKNLDQLRSDLLDGLGNDYQRQRLGNALDAQMQLTRDGMARHVAEQSLAWQRGVAQDRINILTKEAAQHHNDTDLVDALGHAAATAARAHSRVGDGPPGGEAEDAAAAQARSGVLGAAIQARLDRGDTAGANALLTQVQDQLDPAHAGPLQGQIGTLQRLGAAKDYADGIASATPAASLEEIDAQHQAALQQAEADHADDPRQQTLARHFLNQAFNARRQELQQGEGSSANAVDEWLNTPGADGGPQRNLPPPAVLSGLDDNALDDLVTRLDPGDRQVVLLPDRPSPDDGGLKVVPLPYKPSMDGAFVPQNFADIPEGESTPSTQGADQSDDGKILSDASPDPITDGQRYAQAGGRPPTRRPGPGNGTPREETRRDFFDLHRAELEKLEPRNPKLSYVVPPGWVPSQRNVDEMAREAANARARAATRAQPGEAAPNSGNSDLSADDLVRGSVLGGIRSRTPESKSDAPAKLSPSDQLATNRMAGREQERDVYSQLQQQNPRIGAQITLETPSGTKTRIDFMTRHPTTGEIRCIECKASETAPLTPNQRTAFPEIGAEGATIKGAGKPDFPGGTRIPPTNVEIIRKR